MPGGNDDAVRIFHVANAKTIRDFQEIATTVRTVADIRRLFTYNSARALVSRGTSDQLALASWLVNELDRAGPHAAASTEYRMADANQTVVRVFYVPAGTSPQDFLKFAASLRTAAGAQRTVLCEAFRAVAVRGTTTQIVQASELAADRNKSSGH